MSFKIELHALLFKHDLELKSTEKRGEEIILRIGKKKYKEREKYIDLSKIVNKEEKGIINLNEVFELEDLKKEKEKEWT